MSVLARKRGLSAKEFFKKALDIREQVFVMAHKEKIIPKSKRFTFTVPMCDLARSMVRNIEQADAFYPNSSWAVIERKKRKGSNHVRLDAQRSVENMDALFRKLFNPENPHGGGVVVRLFFRKVA